MSANRKRGPSQQASVSDAEWADYLYFNSNTKGPAREIWLHLTCMEMFAMTRDTATNAVVAAKLWRGPRLDQRSSADRRRRRSRAAPRLHLRRQALPRFRRRQHRLGFAGERRPHRRPQLQISPAARHLGRVDGGAERDRRRDAQRQDDAEPARDHRAARERHRRALGQCGADRGCRSRRSHRQARAHPAGGLLLQDLSLAAVGDVRRLDPRHGRPRPRRSEQSPAGRQSAVQRALRSARRRRRPGGSRGGRRGGHSGARGVPHRRPCRDRRPARPSRRRDRRRRLAGLGARASRAPSKPPAAESSPERRPTASTTSNLVCAWERRGPAPDALWRIRPQRS